MRLATAWSRRIAHRIRSRRQGGRLGRPWAASLALSAAPLCTAAAGLTLAPFTGLTGVGSTPVLPVRPVPAGQLRAIITAAASCPELTSPRLAAQLMAASGFNPRARTAGGGSGVAGLTAAEWRQWTPAPGTRRANITANILALAHDDCDLAGQARAARVPGNLWRLTLAAFNSGLPAVIAAHGLPASAARYVTTVTAYATWYAQQSQFSGKPRAALTHPRSLPRGARRFLADGTYYIKNGYSNDVIDVPNLDTTEGIVLDQWPKNGGTNQQWRVRRLGRGVYRITSVLDGEAVDIDELSTSPGADVDQWPYWGGPNQKFRIRAASDGSYTITNINSGEVVEVPDFSVTAGTWLDQSTPDGGANQQWFFQPIG